MGNRPEAVAALFGAALAGAVAVPAVDVRAPPRAGASCSTPAEIDGGAHPGAPARPAASATTSPPSPRTGRTCARVAVLGEPSWDELLAAGDAVPDDRLDERAAAVTPDDDAARDLQLGHHQRSPRGCSTRTGPPRCSSGCRRRSSGGTSSTRMWSSLPMFWTAGLNTAMGSTLAAGGCWVMQETFEPGEALRAHGAGAGHRAVHAPPPDRRARGAPRLGDAPTCRRSRCVYGKSALRPPSHGARRHHLADAGRLRAVRDVRVLLRPLVGHAARRDGQGAWAGCSPATSCASSTPTPGELLGVGEDGRAGRQGPDADEAATWARPPQECFDADGFFHTGDAGSRRRRRLRPLVEGRRTEMIKTGGANVSPAELEVQLRACAPVKLARIVGVPDPRLDQLVVACITLQGRRRGHGGRHPGVPPRAGGLLQGAQARPVLRRRRDPDDQQRHQGARRRPASRWSHERLAAEPASTTTTGDR